SQLVSGRSAWETLSLLQSCEHKAMRRLTKIRKLATVCRSAAESLSHAGSHLFQKITAMKPAPTIIASTVNPTPNQVRLRSICAQKDLDLAGLLVEAVSRTTPNVMAAAPTRPAMAVREGTTCSGGSLVEIPAIVALVARMMALITIKAASVNSV